VAVALETQITRHETRTVAQPVRQPYGPQPAGRVPPVIGNVERLLCSAMNFCCGPFPAPTTFPVSGHFARTALRSSPADATRPTRFHVAREHGRPRNHH
jgi:hypothetical protein